MANNPDDRGLSYIEQPEDTESIDLTEPEDVEAVLTDEARMVLENLDQGVEIQLDPTGEDGMTIAEARALLAIVDKMVETPGATAPIVRGQWARAGGNYTLVGDVVRELPPGYYDTVSSNGQLFFMPVTGRSDKILRFPHAQVDTVISEIEVFWTREEIFRQYRLPYKRGILMYGPPGSGKTSALQLIARDVVERGGIALIFDPDLFPTAYRHLRRVQPETPLVVLMEDLDAILASRVESTVLNLLDGAESMHKVVFVATTNYPENLGPRVINRPSRFDKRIRVGHPDDVGRRMYLESLIEDGGKAAAIDVNRYVKDTHGLSLAHLKELFVATVLIGTPYEEALSHLKAMHLEKATSLDDDKEFKTTIGAVGFGGYA